MGMDSVREWRQAPRAGVVIADADVDTRTALALLLEAAGLRAYVAKDGWDALHLIDLHRPSVVIVSENLALVDGRTLIEMARRDPSLTTPAVILLSESPRPARPGDVDDLFAHETSPFRVVWRTLELIEARRERTRQVTARARAALPATA